MLKKLLMSIIMALLLGAGTSFGQVTDDVRVMHYNLLFYGNNSCRSLEDKNTFFKRVFNHYKPDVITANELLPQERFANSIRDNVLNTNGRSSYKRAQLTNQANASIVNMLYYNSNKVGLARQQVSNTNLRDINHYKLYHKPGDLDANSDTTYFWVATMHLKAGDDNSDESQRANMAGPAMGFAQRPDDQTAYLMGGDMNLQNSQEPAYQVFTDPSRPNWEPFHDPLDQEGFWHNNGRFAATHTQSTRKGNLCDGGSSGGMDDRFDLILISESLEKDQANNVKYVAGSYNAGGQAGNRLNGSITDPNNNQVPRDVATSLKNFSDHLPVMLDLKVSTPGSSADSNTSGLAEEQALQLQAHPNPFQDQLTVRLPIQNSEKLRLYDGRGQLVRQRSVSSSAAKVQWQLPNLESGFYILKLMRPNEAPLVQQLIKR